MSYTFLNIEELNPIVASVQTPHLGGSQKEKPAGPLREYLIQDRHNHHKGHFIVFNEDGETWYNQVGYAEHKATWFVHYEWQLVGCLEWHGYREYITAAGVRRNDENEERRIEEAEKARTIRLERELEPGDDLVIFINQAFRDAWCLAVTQDLALVEYEMPNGRTYLKECSRKRKERPKYWHAPNKTEWRYIPGAAINSRRPPARWKNHINQGAA